jgi:hypothetical protein
LLPLLLGAVGLGKVAAEDGAVGALLLPLIRRGATGIKFAAVTAAVVRPPPPPPARRGDGLPFAKVPVEVVGERITTSGSSSALAPPLLVDAAPALGPVGGANGFEEEEVDAEGRELVVVVVDEERSAA